MVFGIILVAAWVLALATVVLNLTLLPRLTRESAPQSWPDDAPLVSVLIPARNEARAIGETVRRILAQSYRNLELIVVNDRSADRTGEILDAFAGDPRLHVVNGEEPPPGWLGKPWALEQAVRAARGSLLLLVDADVHYEPEVVSAAVAHLQASGIAMVAMLPNVEMETFWERVAMPQLAVAALVLLPTWLANRTTIAALGIGGGPGNLVRREELQAAGGYGALRDAVVDDVGLARLLRGRGLRTHVVRAETLVSLRMYHGGKEIIDGFTKNLFAAFDRRFVFALAMLVMMIAFHFVPYVLAVFGNPLAIVAVVLITVVRIIVFRALRYGMLNALLLHPLMTLFWAWIYVRSIWKTGIRREMHWRGRTYDHRGTGYGSKR